LIKVHQQTSENINVVGGLGINAVVNFYRSELKSIYQTSLSRLFKQAKNLDVRPRLSVLCCAVLCS
jgi:hypothetical protein